VAARRDILLDDGPDQVEGALLALRETQAVALGADAEPAATALHIFDYHRRCTHKKRRSPS
jgi:hypothetical protein